MAHMQPQDMSQMHMGDTNPASDSLMNLASGTSMNPESWKMPMLMRTAGGWQLMFMGSAFIVETQQTPPRGADKFYSESWGMFAASHELAGGLSCSTLCSVSIRRR